MTKTIVVYNPQKKPGEVWLPVLWAQAKTYYEKHGTQKWRWWPCNADSQGEDIDAVKQILEQAQPDVFAVSLYVWNYDLVNQVCKWVRQRWPKCIIITGGPHQYFKHDIDWFRKHPYFDASLPGDCFGERCIQQLLDSAVLDWDQISDVVYARGKSRSVAYSKKITTPSQRQEFDYNWSAFDSQQKELQSLLDHHRQHHQRLFAFSILETTRGCPYGCTYCDWGGGINTKVIKRDLSFVQKDIDALCTFDLDFVYFADANLGIFGERDVKIMQYLVATRKQNLQFFNVGYGGFAKTENKLSHIQEILSLDIKNKLSAQGEIKLSMQSLDPEVLKNIDRKNVSLEKQLATYNKLTTFKRLPVYVELIYGLPGITLEKFYTELDQFGQHNLSVQWYPWQLLPETPAYDRNYRQQHQLVTVSKTVDWMESSNNNPSEIVVGAKSYTTDDYLEMLLASSMYRLLVQGGYLKSSVGWLTTNKIGLGKLVQHLVQEFFFKNPVFSKEVANIQLAWRNILQQPGQGVLLPVQDKLVYPGWYFAARAFVDHDYFTTTLATWIQSTWQVPKNLIAKDLATTIHSQNINTETWQGWFKTDYSLSVPESSPVFEQVMSKYSGFKDSGRIAYGRRRLLGILPL